MNSNSRLISAAFLSLSALFVIGALSCSRAPVKPEAPAVESPSMGASASPVTPAGTPLQVSAGGKNSLVAKPLTGSGDNSEARFSPDGSRIVFVSRFRAHHKQAQVYELHLGRMTEKRITYHDGDDAGPFYSSDASKLLFASSTDEIKQPNFAVQRLMRTYTPNLADKTVHPEPGYELYEQTLHGRSIERLTQAPGFDGDADLDHKGRRIVFSSARSGGGVHLFLQHGKSASRLTDGKVIDRGARFTTDGISLVWSRQELLANGQASSDARLLIANGNFRKSRVLFELPGLHIQPTWNPSGSEIVFSSNLGGKFFNLYALDVAGKCLRRLTNTDFDQLQPALSPDGKRLLFTANTNSHQQIFITDYAPPAECWVPPTPTPVSTAIPASSGPSGSPEASPSPTPATPMPAASPSPAPNS